MAEFQDFEITWNTLVMRFLKEKTVIPLKDISSYSLKSYLEKESGPIAVAKFNYLTDEHKLRQHIEGRIAEAINLALSRHGNAPQKTIRLRQGMASWSGRPDFILAP